jgi:mono/diheme cytochrome c family protein
VNGRTRPVWLGVGAAVASAALVAGFAGCGGCNSQQPAYPPNYTFAPRADRIVLKLPDKPPAALNTAGHRDEEIAALDALGGRTLDPAALPAEPRALLDSFLKDAFGTPADPADVSAPLKLTKDHLAEGARLFKRHCADCHNVNGDGRGAKSGQFVVPFPRDYRQGAFKFGTSGEGMKPRRADLLRTIREGLKGTAMPSFSLLQEGERDLLAGYVVYLSARGEVEFRSLLALAENKPSDPGAALKAILGEWEKADAAPALPAPPEDGEPESPKFNEAVSRGYKLFTAKADAAKGEKSCVECHGEFGRKPVLQWELWGTVAKPANFTEPGLKGGTRPEDVYARIRFGIPAAGMPAHPPARYSEREVWDLVRFVTSAPYPVRLPPEARAAVHPNP